MISKSFKWIAASIAACAAVSAPALAGAQTGTFGISAGGNGVWLPRMQYLDQRMTAADRTPIFPIGGGIDATMEGSWRFIRLAGTFRASFFGEGDDTYRLMMPSLVLGARLPWRGWVFLPSAGIASVLQGLCVRNPPVGVSKPTAPLFDQILAAPGYGECLSRDSAAGIVELGIDREWWGEKTDLVRPGVFVGARISALFAPKTDNVWRWDTRTMIGPATPFLVPSISLVVGFRVGD